MKSQKMKINKIDVNNKDNLVIVKIIVIEDNGIIVEIILIDGEINQIIVEIQLINL